MLPEILAEIDAELTPQGVSTRFGEKYLFENVSPPRLVWVPNVDQIVDPRKQDKEYTSIRTRLAEVEGHLWGISYGQAEALLHNFITAVHRKLHGCFTFGSAQWVPAGQRQWIRYGWAVTLPISVEIPVINKYLTLPTDPDVEAQQPSAEAIVTIVDPPAGPNEAIAVAANKDFNP